MDNQNRARAGDTSFRLRSSNGDPRGRIGMNDLVIRIGPFGAMVRQGVRFAADSLLEGDGFELPVPRKLGLRRGRRLALHLGSLTLRRRGPDWNATKRGRDSERRAGAGQIGLSSRAYRRSAQTRLLRGWKRPLPATR